ncbi:MAG: hypothetical protein BroJett030_01430 [Alphaproteobacteria bacterium]|nr:MAG: hypothetical protein BroJett030_01430 [Alphaproteobacteria bacterium]
MASDGGGSKSGLVPLVAVFGAITLLAVGSGWFIGSQVRQTMETRLAEETAAAETAAAQVEAQARPAVDDEERAAIGKRPGRTPKKPKAADAAAHGGEEELTAASLFAAGPPTFTLDPIVANLGATKGQWIRMEVAVVYQNGTKAPSDDEKNAINEAIVGMLRAKTADDLAGASGFLQFREDLLDTVKVSTGGKAAATKILSLVIE